METNMKPEAELRDRGKDLLEAARAFWEVHHKMGGPRAVVWLAGDDGSLVVFTRGEYKAQLLYNIGPVSEETPLQFAAREDS